MSASRIEKCAPKNARTTNPNPNAARARWHHWLLCYFQEGNYMLKSSDINSLQRRSRSIECVGSIDSPRAHSADTEIIYFSMGSNLLQGLGTWDVQCVCLRAEPFDFFLHDFFIRPFRRAFARSFLPSATSSENKCCAVYSNAYVLLSGVIVFQFVHIIHQHSGMHGPGGGVTNS